MPVFAVEYTYDDRDADRAQIRETHREFLRALLRDGDLLASGPLDGGAGALIIVRATDAGAAVALLQDDPFHTAGLVANRVARAWVPVIGPWESVA